MNRRAAALVVGAAVVLAVLAVVWWSAAGRRDVHRLHEGVEDVGPAGGRLPLDELARGLLVLQRGLLHAPLPDRHADVVDDDVEVRVLGQRGERLEQLAARGFDARRLLAALAVERERHAAGEVDAEHEPLGARADAVEVDVARGLRRYGMAVDIALDGEDGLEKAMVNDYDVVVLDRDLPGRHGDDVCKELRAEGRRAGIIMTDFLLFLLGTVITMVTTTAVLLVGRSEAQDPALNRPPESDGR